MTKKTLDELAKFEGDPSVEKSEKIEEYLAAEQDKQRYD